MSKGGSTTKQNLTGPLRSHRVVQPLMVSLEASIFTFRHKVFAGLTISKYDQGLELGQLLYCLSLE